MPHVCRTVRITGRVQGVAYRAWTESRARAAGLRGWVRNESDGSVSALFCGPDAAVEAMITACHEGPGAAEVRDVQVEDAPGTPPENFRILQ